MAGITYTVQERAHVDVEVTRVDGPPTAFFKSLCHSDAGRFTGRFITALQSIANGRASHEFDDANPAADAHNSVFGAASRSLVERAGEWDSQRFRHALNAFWSTGRGQPLGGPTSIDDIPVLLRVFEHDDVEITPTIDLHFDVSFFEVRAKYRRQICHIIGALARGCDVRVICSGLVLRMLNQKHREELPKISDACRSHREQAPPIEAAVEDALEAVGTREIDIKILRALREASGTTLSYGRLTEEVCCSASRLSHRFSSDETTLVSLGLVETFERGSETIAELRKVGSAYLDHLDAEIGEQAELGDEFRDSVQSHPNSRVSPSEHGEGEDSMTDRTDRPRFHTVEDMSRWEAAAAVAAAPEQGVAVVDRSIEHRENSCSPRWFYDYDGETLAVGAEPHGPYPQAVCVARALASEKTWRTALAENRLDDADADRFRAFLTEHMTTLRESRCLGYLPDAVDSLDEFHEQVQKARDDLLDLTKDAEHADGEKRDSLRSTVMSEALGLAGTMLHLLDLCGVDVSIEIRLPEYSRHYGRDQRDEQIINLANLVAIGSKYGESSAYRQLFETRGTHRQTAITPTVDAADPVGESIASVTIVGDFGARYDEFVAELRGHLSAPDEVHEDAPEFQIELPVSDGVSREAFVRTVRRMAEYKDLTATAETVSLVHGFVKTPYDGAEALAQLAEEDKPEEKGRAVRPAEVRYALGHLDPAQFLRGDHAPSRRKMVAALIRADGCLTREQLAKAADVSTSSIKRHLPVLETTGLLEETELGYRLLVAFDNGDERYDSLVPRYTQDGPETFKARLALKLAARETDPELDDPAWERPSGRTKARDLRPLLKTDECWQWLTDLLPALWGVPEWDDDLAKQFMADSGRTVRFGNDPENEQAPLPDADAAEMEDVNG